MKLRSLDKDSTTITLGQALLLVTVHWNKQQTSTAFRLDFFDSKNTRYLSVEGNKREIEMLNTLHLLIGPTTPLDMIQAIPVTFKELRDRRSSALAYRQGIVHVLQTVYSIEAPDYWQSDTRAFHKWLQLLRIV